MNYIKEIKEFNEVLNKIYNDYQDGKLSKSETDNISAEIFGNKSILLVTVQLKCLLSALE